MTTAVVAIVIVAITTMFGGDYNEDNSVVVNMYECQPTLSDKH